MDDKHRANIIENTDKLINRTKYEKLAHACKAKGLLSPIMLQNLEKIEPDMCVNWSEDEKQYERHKRLFIKITKRGPTAYQELRMILADLKYDSALCVLNALDDDSRMRSIQKREDQKYERQLSGIRECETLITTNGNNNNNSNDMHCIDRSDGAKKELNINKSNCSNEIMLEEFTDEIYPKMRLDVKKSTAVHTHPKLGTYPMQSQYNRGVFFMVNIIDFLSNDEPRRGAEGDAESLLYLFRELGFKLFSYTNISQSDFFKLLDALLNSKYTTNTECFVMALMTHGTRDDDGFERVTFHDGSIVKVEDIERYFHNHICRNLQNKPKIFIFPFCRGNIADMGIKGKIQTDSVSYISGNAKTNIPQLSDVFICYAASPGFKSHRDVEAGSWYIQKFVEMMAANAHDTSFEEIVKMIQAETSKLRTVDGHLQTANSVNMGFNKALFFNPGVWLD
ncbi:caspase Dronc isoform X1 [Glossina fuscipes]|uniref:Caspase Dronc isoform X1 n=2 Tax=Nemorhina TaxID=44051 RepID=A0A8U0W2T3_9MUSC|nr:caspase Dronc isoform X1 [Glossina fuscipes]